MNRLGVAFIAAVIAAASPAIAQKQQSYPVKPIRLVVAFTPGGTPDTLARRAREIERLTNVHSVKQRGSSTK